MNVPGSRIWMGVQARQSGGNDPGEYVHPPDDWDANDSVVELAVVDLVPPYFIEENAEYDSNALMQDNSLLYEGLRIVPYSTGVAVYCRRAIDGPAYADDEALTYRCYYSSSAFDSSTYSAQQNVSFQRAYSATEFPDGNYDREQYIAFIPGLTAGNTYWFYVNVEDNALDQAGNPASPNHSVNTEVASWDLPVLSNTGISVASGLPYAGANMVGEIVANQNGVYMVYPGQGFFVTSPASPRLPELWWAFAVPNYSELPGGSTINMTTQTNITGWDQGLTWPLNAPQVLTGDGFGNATGTLPASMGTVSTGFFVRPGFPSGPNVPNTAVFNFTADLDDPVLPNLQYGMASLERKVSGLWTAATWHTEPGNSGTAFWTRVMGCSAVDHTYTSPQTSSVVSAAILSSAYWNVNPATNRIHELTGTGTPGSIEWPGYVTVDNDLYVDQGFGHAISSDTELVSGAPKQPAAYPLPTAGFLRTSQPLYLLSNSSLDVNGLPQNPTPPYVFSNLKIATTNDPQNPLSWTVSDLISGTNSLPGLIPGDTGSVVGPNAIESSWQPDGQVSRVYAAYCNAIEGNFNQDGLGLTVAVLNNIGAGIPPWNASSLVDDSYSIVDVWNVPGNDVVDIAVQTDAKASWVDFDRLGCAYVSPTGQLILAETIGTGGGATWQPIWPTGNSTAVINQGDVRWVKLA